MAEFATERARAGLELLVACQLAGSATIVAFERVLAQVPRCRELIFEIVVGAQHPGEADLALAVAPDAMPALLADQPGAASWRELAVLEPYKAWIELDSEREQAPYSVFAQFDAPRHGSELRGSIRRLGAKLPAVVLPQVRHLGVLHGRERPEVRLVLENVDVVAQCERWGLPLPEAPPGRHQLAVGLDAEGWRDRVGVERVLRQGGPLPPLPLTAAQARLVGDWARIPGARLNHAKWLAPSGQVKLYLALGG